ncbi:MAG: DUF4230 domain-containing protein [Candidatus Acidiferrales bacterium]
MSFVPPNIERQRVPARGILLGAAIALAVVGLAVWLWTGMGFLQLIGLFRGGTTVINVNQPTVVRQIQQLQRLETVSYTMDKIISGERDNAYLPRFLAGDRLLLVVHGDVIAGVDLGKVQPADVSVRGRTISLRIPAAEIFTTRIDNARTRVYSRDTGLFSTPDPNLESEVREEAERQLQQAALQDGVLKTADQNARTTLSRMLTGLGFEQVEFL